MRVKNIPVVVTGSGAAVPVHGMWNMWVEVSGTSLSSGSIQGNISGSGVWQTLASYTTNATGSIFALGSNPGPCVSQVRHNMSGQVISGSLMVTLAGLEESK